jgi:hypothetical protein
MKKFVTIAMAGIFVLSLQGPGRAQKEVAPPPIPPLLEGQRPLEHPETKETAAPQKPEAKKAKAKPAAKAKPVKNQKKAKVKKLVSKKRQAAAKKKSPKASTKKRPAATPHQGGPDEG